MVYGVSEQKFFFSLKKKNRKNGGAHEIYDVFYEFIWVFYWSHFLIRIYFEIWEVLHFWSKREDLTVTLHNNMH